MSPRGAPARPRPTAAEHFLEVSGLRLRWSVTTGEGRPLLLVNGIGGNLEMWEPLRRCLVGRPVLAPDLPGCGESAVPLLPLGLERIARLLVACLDDLGVPEVDLLGYSFGAAVAQVLARRHPERFASLVLAGATAGWGAMSTTPAAVAELVTPLRYYVPGRAADPVVFGDPPSTGFEGLARARRSRPPNPLGYAEQLLAIAGWTSVPWLGEIGQRTLVLAGALDRVVPAGNAEYLAAHIARARPVVLPGMGHLFLLSDDPERPAAEIRRFLAGP